MPNEGGLGAEFAGCSVLIATGLYRMGGIDRVAATAMLRAHLKDTARACRSERGSALAVDPETGCTATEMSLGGKWNFKSRSECAEWCPPAKTAGQCPDLLRAVINALEELRLALRAHWGAECVVYDLTRKAVMEDRSVLGAREVPCSEATPRTEVA